MRCHRQGVLTSATLLVNRPATGQALALACDNPALGVGLHLNLTEGAPVAPASDVASLVDRRGFFLPYPRQFWRVARGPAPLDELEREFRAQIEFVLERGLRPTHVDGHLHVHAYPRALPLVVRLMREYGIRAMRSPLMTDWVVPYRRRDWTPNAARWWRAGRRRAWLRASGVLTTDYLLNSQAYLLAPDPAARLLASIDALGGGTVELMAHPAWNRRETIGTAEVALLTDPRLRAGLDERGVRCIHYGELVGLP